MKSRAGRGVVASLIGGVLFGIMMQVMTAPTPDGGQVPMLGMVAMLVDSDSLAVGWIVHLAISGPFGLIFGWLFGARVTGPGAGLGWGAVYGLIWWVLGGLLLMPLILGLPAFAPLTMPEMRSVALGSLAGHLLYGLVLGGSYAWLAKRSVGMELRPQTS